VNTNSEYAVVDLPSPVPAYTWIRLWGIVERIVEIAGFLRQIHSRIAKASQIVRGLCHLTVCFKFLP